MKPAVGRRMGKRVRETKAGQDMHLQDKELQGTDRARIRLHKSILTRLWLGAATIGVVISIAVGVVAYITVRDNLMSQIQENTVINAQIAAAKIDSEMFQKIGAESGKDEAFYAVHGNLSDFLTDETEGKSCRFVMLGACDRRTDCVFRFVSSF